MNAGRTRMLEVLPHTQGSFCEAPNDYRTMSRPQDDRLPYLPGIDALRALAVVAVFLYHAGVGWAPGGFLGVDVFFVISGYLITSLLLSEYRRGRHVDVGRFWLRRARRLLPAVGVFVAVTMVAAAVLEPDRLAGLRGDAIASLAYFANWHFVLSHQSYFEQFQRPSLFRHLWSLSVEEQFYLLWPLIFAAGMKLLGRTRLLVGVLAGAAGSVALAWLLFDPQGDVSRVYYGTDTHAVGLLAGVALALVWRPWALRRGRPGPWTGPVLDAVGVLALSYVVLAFLRVHDYDLALFHGGYAWLALATGLLIAVLAHPAARMGGEIAKAPLLWLGVRSYSFYLWHWPVLALTRPGVDVALPRGVLVPLQLLAVLALADLSYRFVELPFRGRAALPAISDAWLRRFGRPALLASVVAVVLLVGWGGVVSTGDRRLEPGVAAASTAESARVGPGLGGGGSAWYARRKRGARIVALGDSVMIAARDRLARRFEPGFSMNAHVGRQADEFVALARRLKASGQRPDVLIVQLGANGPLYGEEMDELRKATSEARHLLLVNDDAPVSWMDESNAKLAEAAELWPRTSLIDWKAAIEAHPHLTWDGVHLRPAGAGLYARLLAREVRAALHG
jgi:peptidoglycan/LPS O-acetylase OafA/YrhL